MKTKPDWSPSIWWTSGLFIIKFSFLFSLYQIDMEEEPKGNIPPGVPGFKCSILKKENHFGKQTRFYLRPLLLIWNFLYQWMTQTAF